MLCQKVQKALKLFAKYVTHNFISFHIYGDFLSLTIYSGPYRHNDHIVTKVFVWMSKSDIVVLALLFFEKKFSFQSEESGLVFRKSYRDIPEYIWNQQLGSYQSIAWPLLLILTGYVTTSSILIWDKKCTKTALQNTPGLIGTLITLTEDPQCLTFSSTTVAHPRISHKP